LKPENLHTRSSLRLVLATLVLFFSAPSIGIGVDSEHNPLQPAATSSPRATLKGFVEILNDGYARVLGTVDSYMASQRLYLSAEENRRVTRILEALERAKRTLDLSELPAALADSLSVYRALQLKEVLDRIDLPAFDSIPDAAAIRDREFKSWTLPGTEITIARVEKGPRAGEYLFTPETVDRIPEFYARVRHLPYRPGASAGWYERYRYGGAGLRGVIPYKWMLALPGWAKKRILDQPLWRWLGLMLVLLAATTILRLIWRLADRWKKSASDSPLRAEWSRLVKPIALLILIPLLVHVLQDNLRISGYLLQSATIALWALFTLSLTWVVWLGGNVIAESIVSSQQLLVGGIDSQLTRLGLRLLATMLSVAILVVGAQQLGLPAYSVVAGLGVGGIAVALAARESLANLLGSLLIMFEKPFRVGHWIKVEDAEGIVESVGFRSTRIRTFHNSLVSIPSNKLVNSTVDNLQMREYHRVRTTLRITLDTPPEKIEQLVEGIKQIIRSHPETRKDYFQVVLNDFGENSLDILLNCFVRVPDWASELDAREQILLEVLRLAKSMNVRMAIPNWVQTIDGSPG
jgi:MscS family membrane protein